MPNGTRKASVSKSKVESAVKLFKNVVSAFVKAPTSSLAKDVSFARDLIDLFSTLFTEIEDILPDLISPQLLKLSTYCAEKLLFELSSVSLKKAKDDNKTDSAFLELSLVFAKFAILWEKPAEFKSIVYWASLFERIHSESTEDVRIILEFLNFCDSALNSNQLEPHHLTAEVLCVVLSCFTANLNVPDVRNAVENLLPRIVEISHNKSFLLAFLKDVTSDQECFENLVGNGKVSLWSKITEHELLSAVVRVQKYAKKAIETCSNCEQFGLMTDFVLQISQSTCKLQSALAKNCSQFLNFCMDSLNALTIRLSSSLDFLLDVANGEKSSEILTRTVEKIADFLMQVTFADTRSKLNSILAKFASTQLRNIADKSNEQSKLRCETAFKILLDLRLRILAKTFSESKESFLEASNVLAAIAHYSTKANFLSSDLHEIRGHLFEYLLRIPEAYFDVELRSSLCKCWMTFQKKCNFKVPLFEGSSGSLKMSRSKHKHVLVSFVDAVLREETQVVPYLSFAGKEFIERCLIDIKQLQLLEDSDYSRISSLLIVVFNSHLEEVSIKSVSNLDLVVQNYRELLSENRLLTSIVVDIMEFIVQFLLSSYNTTSEEAHDFLETAKLFQSFSELVSSEKRTSELISELNDDVVVLFANCACIYEFCGFRIHSLYIWALLSRWFTSLEALLDSGQLRTFEFVSFCGFMAALKCGNVYLCSVLFDNFKNCELVDKNCFVVKFLDLKLKAFTKELHVEQIMYQVLDLIDLSHTQPWAFFQSSLSLDFLVDLLAESDISCADLKTDPKSTTFVFFAKWKCDSFRFWKSLTRRSVNFDSGPEASKPVVPFLFNPRLKHPICGSVVPVFAFQHYAELTYMLKSVGLVDVARSYDSFAHSENLLNKSHGFYLRNMFSAKAFLESAFCYAYINQLDRCYEMIIKCCNFYLESQYRIDFEAIDVYVHTEVGDAQLLKSQSVLSDNVPEIHTEQLKSQVDHKVSCLCHNCTNLPKCDNIVLAMSLLTSLPRSDQSNFESVNISEELSQRFNDKLQFHSEKVKSLLEGSSKGCLETKQLENVNDQILSYQCKGKIPSVQNFTGVSFMSTKIATEAALQKAVRISASEEKALISGNKTPTTRKKKTDSESLIEVFDNLSVVRSTQPKRRERNRTKSKQHLNRREDKENNFGRITRQRKTSKPSSSELFIEDKLEVKPVENNALTLQEIESYMSDEDCSASPKDYCSRLICSQLKVDADILEWGFELYNVVCKNRDFKLLRELAKTKLSSLAQSDCILRNSINPTAFNVLLFSKTPTDDKFLNALHEFLKPRLDRHLKSCKTDENTDANFKLPKNLAVVEIFQSDRCCFIRLSTRQTSCYFSYESLERLCQQFQKCVDKSLILEPNMDRKHYWKQRYAGEEALKNCLLDLNLELMDLESKIQSEFSFVSAISLIVEDTFACIPWENLDCFIQKSVGRYPSFDFFRYHLEMCQTTCPDSKVDVNKMFYLINPSGDLMRTQLTFENFFSNLTSDSDLAKAVTGITGTEPLPEDVQKELELCDLYLYCGHGAGSKFYPSHALRSKVSDLKCVALLIGCSSGSLSRLSPNVDPTTIAYDFLLKGCPAVVANLWHVSDREIDLFTVGLLDEIFATSNGMISEAKEKSRKSLSLILKDMKECVKLPAATGHAPVLYGLPSLCLV